MGNGQHRYLTNNDAVEIIGSKVWTELRVKLERNGSKVLDFELFRAVLHSRFERMPAALGEALFRAFTNETHGKVEHDIFISSIAVLCSEDKPLIQRFLARIYDSGSGLVERRRVEDILQLAYSERGVVRSEVFMRTLDSLFRGRRDVPLREFEQWPGRLSLFLDWVLEVMRIFTEPLPPKLFYMHRKYSSMLDAEDLATRFRLRPAVVDRLKKQFYQHCSPLKPEMRLAQFKLWTSPLFLPELLAEIVFFAKSDNFNPAWRITDFVEFCMVYARGSREERATAICTAFFNYDSKLQYASSGSQIEAKADGGAARTSYAEGIARTKVVENGIVAGRGADDSNGDKDADHRLALCFQKLVHVLAQPMEKLQQLTGSLIEDPSDLVGEEMSEASLSSLSALGAVSPPEGVDPSTKLAGRKRSHSLNLDETSVARASMRSPPFGSPTGNAADNNDPNPELVRWYLHSATSASLPPLLANKLSAMYAQPFRPEQCVSFVVQHYHLLPGLRDLSITAACLFGMQPSAQEEKEFIVELSVRHMQRFPSTCTAPYGPPDTEWCLLSKHWLESWRLYVGQKNGHRPGPVDNTGILRRSDTRALGNVSLGHDVEVIPPLAIQALIAWYSGGPVIKRRVVGTASQAELELFPLALQVLLCDAQGKAIPSSHKEMLFSASCTVLEVVNEIAVDRRLAPSKMRLWDYAKDHWRDQSILSPHLTLRQAGLIDGQRILVEVSQLDGSWPRSQLQAQLDGEDLGRRMEEEDDAVDEDEAHEGDAATGAATAAASHATPSTATAATATVPHRSAAPHTTVTRRHDGLIGLDNLGNTCYLNASLQALLHTDLLVDYFLSGAYKRDLNVENKHGCRGRLAVAFGRIAHDLWTAQRKCLTPRDFFREVATLRDQFAGNDQHDAHELLAFLLDGLSEDLNLVTTKPYTEQPDSDGRQDGELADIWWENHLKRDRSVVQALFTGQFKSVMTCACSYSSARFEPFNFLPVPIPEDTHRVLMVLVIPRQLGKTVRVAVRVPKYGVVWDVIEKIKELRLEGVEGAPSEQFFVVGDLYSFRVRSFISADRRLDFVRDGEVLTFFQVTVQLKENDDAERPGAVLVASEARSAEPEDPPLPAEEAPPAEAEEKAAADAEGADAEAAAAVPAERTLSDPAPASPPSSPMPSRLSPIAQPLSTQTATAATAQLSSTDLAVLAGVASPDTPPSPPPVETTLVRIAFSQRRVRFMEGQSAGLGGYDYFKPEAFGLPVLEVLPATLHCSDLYDLMEARLGCYFKAPVAALVAHHRHLRQTLRSSASLSRLSADSPTHSSSTSREALPTGRPEPLADPFEAAFALGRAPADLLQTVASVTTDEVVAGPIPRRGFTLRLVNGGNASGMSCSKCGWLRRCQGCVLPDNDTVSITLLDGESVAVDWHFVIFEDLVDTQMATFVGTHASVSEQRARMHESKVPLRDCMDKFTEQEDLAGVVCPKCYKDDSLKRSFMLWRLPPVLIVQLKRFQFDRTSRKKLTQRIDFPFRDLDLRPYLAATRPQEGLEDTRYDLYCVIHHIGALGGGHYVCTVKQRAARKKSRGRRLASPAPTDGSAHGGAAVQGVPLPASAVHSGLNTSINSSSSSSSNGGGGWPGDAADSPTEEAVSGDGQWFCLNDNLVTPVADLHDIAAPSAYVLFYLRRDMAAAVLPAVLQQLRVYAREEDEDEDGDEEAPPAGVGAEAGETQPSPPVHTSGASTGTAAPSERPPPKAAAMAPPTTSAAVRLKQSLASLPTAAASAPPVPPSQRAGNLNAAARRGTARREAGGREATPDDDDGNCAVQ